MVRKRPPPSRAHDVEAHPPAAAGPRHQHDLLAAARQRAAEQPAVEVDRLPLPGAARMDRQVQAGPHAKPHARGRRRDRVVDVAAVAEASRRARRRPSAARRATPRRRRSSAPRAWRSSRALTAVVLETMSIAALAIGAPSAVRSRPRTTCAAPEPAHEQGPAPPPAPVRGQPREVAGPVAVGRAAQRRIRPRPDRLARRDRPRDRPEDRRPIPGRILEQHPHDVLALRQLARVDVQRAVVDAQRARLGGGELVECRIRADVAARPRAIAKRHRERIGAVDLDDRAEQAAADIGAVEAEVHDARPRLRVGRGAREPADRRRGVVDVEPRGEHVCVERLDRRSSHTGPGR